MLQSGDRARRQCRLLWSPIPNLNLAGESIRVSSPWKNQLLCSKDGSVPDENVSRSHFHPIIPEAARFNLAAASSSPTIENTYPQLM